MKNVKIKRLVGALLLIAMLMGVIPTNMSLAATNTKTMRLDFSEELDGNNRSKSVTIPKLKNVVSVKSSTGTATHSVSGEEVTVNVKGGTPSRQVNNPKKYSKTETSSSTSSSNSFSSTKNYNSGGYAGTLDKDGASKVISGSYAPSHSKDVTDTRFSQGSNSNPSNVFYNSGGYSGSLSRDNTTTNTVQTGGSAPQSKYVTAQTSSYYNSGGYSGSLSRYLYSGSYTAEDTKYVTNQLSANYNKDGYSGTLTKYVYSGTLIPADSKTVTHTIGPQSSQSFPSTYSYNLGGYTGTLSKNGGVQVEEVTVYDYETRTLQRYNGSKPESHLADMNRYGDHQYFYWPTASSQRKFDYIIGSGWVDGMYVYGLFKSVEKIPSTVNQYLQNYSGTATRPESDTRVYRYQGNVTKPAIDTRVYRYRGLPN